MQQITIETFSQEELNAMMDARMAEWTSWLITAIEGQNTVIEGQRLIISDHAKALRALRVRVKALEDLTNI